MTRFSAPLLSTSPPSQRGILNAGATSIAFMKHPEHLKIWNSLTEKHTLFWASSSDEEARNLRLARFGQRVSVTLLTLLGTIEIIFFLALLWQLLK